MKLEEFFADPDRARQYREWLTHPVTARVVEILQELSVPVPLETAPGVDLGDTSLYAHGFNLGQNTTLNLLRGLDVARGRLLEARKQADLAADYGSRNFQG